jgi:hypothetical protein
MLLLSLLLVTVWIATTTATIWRESSFCAFIRFLPFPILSLPHGSQYFSTSDGLSLSGSPWYRQVFALQATTVDLTVFQHVYDKHTKTMIVANGRPLLAHHRPLLIMSYGGRRSSNTMNSTTDPTRWLNFVARGQEDVDSPRSMILKVYHETETANGTEEAVTKQILATGVCVSSPKATEQLSLVHPPAFHHFANDAPTKKPDVWSGRRGTWWWLLIAFLEMIKCRPTAAGRYTTPSYVDMKVLLAAMSHDHHWTMWQEHN